MIKAYTYRPAALSEASRIQELISSSRPPLKALQFWYKGEDLIMVLSVSENPSEFAAVQFIEIRRAIVDAVPKRDFEQFVYAPMFLEKI